MENEDNLWLCVPRFAWIMIVAYWLWPLEKGTVGLCVYQTTFWSIFVGVIFLCFRGIRKAISTKKHQYDFSGQRGVPGRGIGEGEKRYIYKCRHCEDIRTFPNQLFEFTDNVLFLKNMPRKIAGCEMGSSTTWKERITGLYDCYCGPLI